MPSQPTPQIASLFAAVYELSHLLNTGLDRRSVQICMALIDAGVNPQALAGVVVKLRGLAADAAASGGGVPERKDAASSGGTHGSITAGLPSLRRDGGSGAPDGGRHLPPDSGSRR